jgi:hypothetical protein
MRLRYSQASAIVLIAGLAVLGLVACVQDGRQARLEPRLNAGYGLFYMDEGPSVKLAYGAPNSDDVGLMMECAKGSRTIDVSDIARNGAAPTLTLASDGRIASLKAQPGSGDGAALLTARTRSDIAPLQAFRRSGRMDVAYSGAEYGIVATPAEKPSVERFFSACEHAA